MAECADLKRLGLMQEAEEAREASAVGHRAEMLRLSQESAALREQVVSLEQGIAAHKGAITGLQVCCDF